MVAFFLAPRFASGPDAFDALRGLGAQRAAIVVDPAIARLGWVDRATDPLERDGASVEVATIETGGPTVASTDRLAERLGTIRADLIVAIGGGSTIEGAQAAWIRYARPDVGLGAVTPLTDLRLREKARFVAAPSTSGSGAEAGWTSLVRTPDGSTIEVASRELVPDWALLDPRLPASLPAPWTAATGAELVVQAVEALSTEWSSPFTDALAREALADAGTALPNAFRRPDDLEARESLHHAAAFAGLAASNAQRGAAHALAVALGPETDVPYGRLLGILGPYVAEYNYPSVREKLGRSASVLGPNAGKDRSALAERMRSLLGPLGIPRTLAEAGVPPEVLRDRRAVVAARARASSGTGANPRVPSEEEYARLLAAAFDGVAVMF